MTKERYGVAIFGAEIHAENIVKFVELADPIAAATLAETARRA